MDGLMSTRYRIEHTSHYRYDHDVVASFNEARLTPQLTRTQSPLESNLRIDQSTWTYAYVDYWGTQVRVFEVARPHRDLVVAASSLVEVTAAPAARRDVTWEQLRSRPIFDEFGEYLMQTAATRPPDDLAGLAEAIAADAPTPEHAALGISAEVHRQMTYLPGSTGVSTVAAEAWTARSGVCQDYAHLVVGALRGVGIPARYVSGYLHPHASPRIGEAAVGESHAWVQWWVGDWVGHDPTNDADVAERHVLVGAGRDYADVPPIKGILAGSPLRTELDVAVEITRLA
jgi:transglutaminase-like putative cysteine protease